MREVIPGVWNFTGLMAGRAYLIEDGDGLTVIDTSLKPSGPKMLKQITERGHKPSDLKRILITHAHPDHVGGLPFLKRETGAQVIASEAEQPVIEGQTPIPRPTNTLLKMPKVILECVPVDRVVKDGEMITEVLGGLQVILTPGHAPGHIAFWQPQKRLLFAGDTIFHLFRLRLPPGFVTVDMEQDKRSVKRLAELEPSVVCFGHGDPLKEDAAQKVQAFASKLS